MKLIKIIIAVGILAYMAYNQHKATQLIEDTIETAEFESDNDYDYDDVEEDKGYAYDDYNTQ